MKNSILLLFSFMLSFHISSAQTETYYVNEFPLDSIQSDYLEAIMRGDNIYIDYGQDCFKNNKHPDRQLFDSQRDFYQACAGLRNKNRELANISSVGRLCNLMSKSGWEFVDTISYVSGYESSYTVIHCIFRRKKA